MPFHTCNKRPGFAEGYATTADSKGKLHHQESDGKGGPKEV